MIFPASKGALKSYTDTKITLRWSTLGYFNPTQHKERKKMHFWSTVVPQRWSPCRWPSLCGIRPLALLARPLVRRVTEGFYFKNGAIAWCIVHAMSVGWWMDDMWLLLLQKIIKIMDFFYFPSNLWAKALKSLQRLKCLLNTFYEQCPLTIDLLLYRLNPHFLQVNSTHKNCFVFLSQIRPWSLCLSLHQRHVTYFVMWPQSVFHPLL